jgi:arylsulfatase A-like enzyme
MKEETKKNTKKTIGRRGFLGRMAGLGAASAVGIPTLAASRRVEGAPAILKNKKPNILYLLTDQQHYNAVAALGNPYLRTPAMDTLVDEGTVLEDNYCTNPVCMPSRASMFTGVMPTEAGIWVNTTHQVTGAQLDSRIPTMGDWFHAKGGYDSIYAGKWHLNHSNTYSIPGFRVIAAGSEHRGDLPDMHVSRACEGYLRDYGRRGRQDPFLMVCSLVQPHDVCHWVRINEVNLPQPWYREMESVARIPPLPDNFGIPDGESAAVARRRAGGANSRGDWNEDHWRYYLWNYYRQVEMVDAEIERVLVALEEARLAEDTLVVLSSDHGEGMAEHQLERKGFLYDSATKVPFIARYPGHIQSGHRNPRTLSSLIDLMPTFCDYAGIEAPSSINHAVSLRGVLDGRQKGPVRSALVVEDNQPNMAPTRQDNMLRTGRQVRTERYSYIRYFDDENELLIDLEKDPGGMNNLARNANYTDVLRAHRQHLVEWESRIRMHPLLPENPWPSLKI